MRTLKYLLIRIGGPSAILNFVINAAIGALLYGSLAEVAWTGEPSVLGDTVIGTFLVALFTAYLIAPTIRRDANAGLVAGRSKALLPLPQRRGWQALVVALIVATIAVAFTLFAEAAPGNSSLNGGEMVLWKGLTSAFAALFAIVIAGQHALAGQPDRVAERDAALERARSVEGTPLEMLDKACIAATHIDRGCTNAPTWHLVVDAHLEKGRIRNALAQLITRFPSISTRVVAMDGPNDYSRDYRFVARHTDADDILTIESEDIATVKNRVLNTPIDQFEQPPLHFHFVAESAVDADGTPKMTTHILVHQHHGLADGRAFIHLLTELGDALRAPSQQLATTPVPRHSEAVALDLAPAARSKLTRKGLFRHGRDARRRKKHPLKPLPSNVGKDYSGGNRTLHVCIDDALLEEWRPIRGAEKLGLNAVLTAAFIVSVAKHAVALDPDNAPDRIAALLIAETRPRSGKLADGTPFESFANHLSSYIAEVSNAQQRPLLALAADIQAQVAAEHSEQAHLERLLFETFAVRWLPIDAMREILFEKADLKTQLNFSNLIPLPFPTIELGDATVQDVWITTPTSPPHGLVLTVIRYNGQLRFNFNYPASVMDDSDVEAIAAHFAEALTTMGPEFETTTHLSA